MSKINYKPAWAYKDGDPCIMQVPIISASHFPREDYELLEHPDNSLFQSDEATGFIMAIDLQADVMNELKQSTRELLPIFHELGYRYLRIDTEVGDIIPELPTFEW